MPSGLLRTWKGWSRGVASALTPLCAPSDAVREKLSRARCDEALAEGLALYEAGKYPQAIAQFRKVLALAPENAEAQKHLDYAEKLAQDDTLSDRFTRLE